MEKRDLFGVKDFFPKEIAVGTPHLGNCNCEICLKSDEIYEKLTSALDYFSSQKISTSVSKRICNYLDIDLLKSLGCANGIEFEELLNVYKEAWQEGCEGNPAINLNAPHGDTCSCLVCSIKKEVVSKLDELSSSKSLDDSDLFEMIKGHDISGSKKISSISKDSKFHLEDRSLNEDRTKQGDKVESYLICEPNKPTIVTVKNDVVESILDGNNMNEIPIQKLDTPDLAEAGAEFQKLSIEPLKYNELIDICLCEPGKLGPFCLKHSIAYCQHMETKLYEEGCTCTREVECLFCQRLKCNFCSHERLKPSICQFMDDEETDDLTVNVSSWLDGKLTEAGASPELIRQFSEPINKLKKEKSDFKGAEKNDENIAKDIHLQLADHIKRNVLDAQIWNTNAARMEFKITDQMKDEVLNLNELFDIRPFPRCYRLRGVKNDKGVYSEVKEEFMNLSFDAWKMPTQYVEQTYPLASPIPDLEVRLEREEEIRKRIRNQRSSTTQKKVKVVGLSEDWRPVVEVSPDNTDYKEDLTTEEKQAWAQKTYEEIMDKCNGLWKQREENELWCKVQPILDKYCEETVEYPPTNADKTMDLDELMKSGSVFAQKMFDKFPNSNFIGYKPELWNGLEDWKPPENENEVRRRLMDEVKKIANEISSFKNDYERAWRDQPGVEINVEETLKNIINSLPAELKAKIERYKSELPEDWLSNPDAVLMALENSSIGELIPRSRYKSESSTKVDKQTTERTVSGSETFQLSDEENMEFFDKTEQFFYDDEEQSKEYITEDAEKESTSQTALVDKAKEPPVLVKEDELAFQTTSRNTRKNFVHNTAPYVTQLKEEMMKNCPEGLHPIQKLWYDRPMFPFWTPSVIYDLSEIEKLFFDGVPEYSIHMDETQLKELESRLIGGKTDKIELPDVAKLEKIDEGIKVEVADEVDATAVKDETVISAEREEMKTSKPKTKSKRKAQASISDDDCLINEDEFKAEIEKLLKVQELKKEAEVDSNETGGALSLEQIKKGIAGRVKSIKEGAIELDTTKDIDLESVLPCPALKYRFKLDIFQKQAIIALEAGLSVFVAAHTSAGKTVAAEYAIAMAMRNGCRVVYTSPIKALSNQKYNDFTKKFKGQMKVGIITGDVQLNKEAECLIMTTEILRSMLYNQSSILSDLEYVIFDEVHYFNDPERGNVWEEVLILLPHQCQLVMLSATVPDVMNFASWVGSLRKREVVVTTTLRRPVPLKHYIHFSTDPNHVKDVLPVREAEGKFLSENFQKAIKMKESLAKNVKYGGKTWKKQSDDWVRFIKGHLKRHQRLPAVVFSFSRKRCDELAQDIQKHIDLVEDAKMKRHIESFFNRQINMLQAEDRNIEQIVKMKGLLQKGIGVHHSGILPILKEIVEVLFSESQIKLLFATETFAMGVNMPAKTVVFQQVWKYDGYERRSLKPAEYTQMAGRAGRRGIDKSGTVIITEWNDRLDRCVAEDDLKTMLTGNVDPLESQFRLRYSMILTALKPEGGNSIHSIIQKSFFDFSLKAQKNKTQKLTEKGYDELKRFSEEMRMMPPSLRDMLCDYCNITYQLFNLHKSIRERMFEHKHLKLLLKAGCLVIISYYRYVNVFGVILNIDQVAKTYDIAVMKNSQCIIKSLKDKYPEATEEDVENWYRLVGFRKMELLPVSHIGHSECKNVIELLQCKASNILSIVKSHHFPTNRGVISSAMETLKLSKRSHSQNLDSLLKFFAYVSQNIHSLVYLDEDSIHFNNTELKFNVQNYLKLSRAFNENIANMSLPSSNSYPLINYLEVCYWFEEKQRAIDKRKVQAQKEELKSLFKDFDSKLEFLKNNKYIKEDDDVVDMKGRIASRMTKFEVFVTEILLKNVLEDLDGTETAALLSCLVIPSISTEFTDSTNQLNPLFKPIVTNEFEPVATPSFPSKMSRQDLKKSSKSLQKSEAEKKEDCIMNSLIEEYLNLPQALVEAIGIVNEIRDDLISQEKNLEIEPMEGADLNKVTFFLVPIVYAWAQGKPICDIMKVLVTNIQEGILVRWIINLNETIRDIDSATHHFLKDSSIKEKFESASNSIKRGIIDTPSLYLNQRTETG